jgi:GDP-4-dehydro-6-deoxy-D-mannose reductase
MHRRILVTGLSGFVGKTLSAMQAEFGVTAVSLHDADITDVSSLNSALVEAPDAVIHLAAQSFVPQAFADPKGTFEVNFIGTYHLLVRLKEIGFRGAFLLVSSGDVYGAVPESELPISESRHPQPRNPYAVSKLAAEALCRQWSACEPDWRIMIARPFNHIGPGQSERFVISGIARQIALIRAGQQQAEIDVGDIDVTRDFLDVADVIRAYFALLERGVSGETYNVCSGRDSSIRTLLERLLTLSGTKADICQDRSRFRPAEQRRVVGSCDKLTDTTGWRPSVPLDTSLTRILNDWTARISS